MHDETPDISIVVPVYKPSVFFPLVWNLLIFKGPALLR